MELFKGLVRLASHRLGPSLRRQQSRGMQTDAQRSLAVFPAGSNGEFNLPEGKNVQSIDLVCLLTVTLYRQVFHSVRYGGKTNELLCIKRPCKVKELQLGAFCP